MEAVRITCSQTNSPSIRKRYYDVVLGYWLLLCLILFFLVFGGYLDVTTWLITFQPSPWFSSRPIASTPIPFIWFMVPFLILGLIFTLLAWAGYELKGIPVPRNPLSEYDPFTSKGKQEQTPDENS